MSLARFLSGVIVAAVIAACGSFLATRSYYRWYVDTWVEHHDQEAALRAKYEGWGAKPIHGMLLSIPPRPGTAREAKNRALRAALLEMQIEDEVARATAEIRAKHEQTNP